MAKSKTPNQHFIPALGADWATRFYDPLVRFTTKEFEFKRALIAQANLQNGQTILDLGCGTGTLSIGINRRFPEIEINAVDADEKVLQIAKLKAKRRNAKISFQRCFADSLPYENESFDHIFSTLLFHHLKLETKSNALGEIQRVVKPGGQVHIADYGKPANLSQKAFSNVIRLIDGDETTRDNFNGKLLSLIRDSGFSDVMICGEFRTILGTIRIFRARKS